MDNIRLILIVALAYLGFLIYQAWQKDYQTPAPAPVAQVSVPQDQAIPSAPASAAIDQPGSADVEVPAVPGVGQSAVATAPGRVMVETDTLDLLLDGSGNIVELKLKQYPVSLDQPDQKFQLLNTAGNNFFVAQSGLLAADQGGAPSHKSTYRAAAPEYRLQQGSNELGVDLVAEEAGLKVTKSYRFQRGSHSFQLVQTVENTGGEARSVREYRQLQRGEPEDSGNAMMYTYTGAAIWTAEDKYQKFDFDKLAEGQPNRDATGGWVAMIQHYFLAALVPDRETSQHLYGKRLSNGVGVIGTYGPAVQLAPGASHSFSGSVYTGPKAQEELAALATGLDLTVDYGWLTLIAQPMYWILSWIENLVGNWGWTIIIFTVLIKAVFFKLSESSYRSMAGLRKLTPRIQALKDRYGDDKQRMQQAMMEIYKKEKINPLGGCLPMLVQIPFFIALYWVLLESVELRQAPWMLWIQDLSEKDPYFILPLLMGATMFIQQKLNPPPPDPMQEKIMLMLPVVFTGMFAFFPSGLVLYWFVNNLLSIAQQWVITRRIEGAASAKA